MSSTADFISYFIIATIIFYVHNLLISTTCVLWHVNLNLSETRAQAPKDICVSWWTQKHFHHFYLLYSSATAPGAPLSKASTQPKFFSKAALWTLLMLALCSVLASVTSKTCTTSSAPCSICCYCLRLCMASWWCREGLLPINDSIQYRSSSSWLVNSEQSDPTLIEMKTICLLGCRVLDEPSGPMATGRTACPRLPASRVQ